MRKAPAKLSILSCEISSIHGLKTGSWSRKVLSILSCEISARQSSIMTSCRTPFNSLLRDQILLSPKLAQHSFSFQFSLARSVVYPIHLGNEIKGFQFSLARSEGFDSGFIDVSTSAFNSLLRDQYEWVGLLAVPWIFLFQFSLARSGGMCLLRRVVISLCLSILSCEISPPLLCQPIYLLYLFQFSLARSGEAEKEEADVGRTESFNSLLRDQVCGRGGCE